MLVVEDSEDDALLLVHEIRRGGYNPIFERVDTAETMSAALADKTWDIILADYVMPQFSGLEALKVMQRSGIDLPFIVVSGKIVESTAIETMKAGAHDYLMKGNLVKLIPTVRRELREADERRKRKEAERALRESEERFRNSVETMLDGFAIFSAMRDDAGNIIDFRYEYINGAGCQLNERTREELVGHTMLELLLRHKDIDLFSEYIKLVETGQPLVKESLYYEDVYGKDLHLARYYDIRAAKLGDGFAVTWRDITEKKKLQAQLLQAQRMESIGTLSGGLAHNINNMLTPMMLSLQMLKQKYTDEQSQRLLNILETNAQRSADLIKQVMSFTRGIEGERKIIQVTDLISDIEKIAKQTFPKSIEVRADIPEYLWKITGDSTQLHQVLMNMCVNAHDAMPDGGILNISAENLLVDENYARVNIGAKAGSYVVIIISDTGTGIPPKILDRIFEPFFTTKEFGKGTGLCLSVSLAIVKSHGGFINVHSETGKGATFRIHLPAVVKQAGTGSGQ